MLTKKQCSKARRSRDPRFDGKFFTAVKTTGIYCRPICPANTPLEKNVEYYTTAIQAANAGYRPCLRCRPDSAPNSAAWKGINTTLDRAIALIDEGELEHGSISSLASRLGISERYLRKLFTEHIGISPKAYALYQQCLFAKQLLHQTNLPITQVALTSGFKSIRRFNDSFKSQLSMTPSAVRKSSKTTEEDLTITLSYCPPYNWAAMQNFYSQRIIEGLEWCNQSHYGRTFQWAGSKGKFTATHDKKNHCFHVSISIDNLTTLKNTLSNIKRVLDIDVNMELVDEQLQHTFGKSNNIISGLRLPGTWSLYEAGIRAILGQQISVKAAHNLIKVLVTELGEKLGSHYLFPTPHALIQNDLEFLRTNKKRKQTLKDFSLFYLSQKAPHDPDEWISINGIGPWTINYAKMRGLSDPNIFLGNDLGIKKALNTSGTTFSPEKASPWQSYLTIQLWNRL